MRSELESNVIKVISALYKGENTLATVALETISVQNPEVPGARLGLSALQCQQGKFEDSRETLEALNRDFPNFWIEKRVIDPESTDLLAAGVAAAERGNFKEAEEILTQVARTSAEQGIFHLIGLCKFRMNDLVGAIECLENEVRLYPENRAAYTFRATLMEHTRINGRAKND